jgi:hypothetical protein
LATLSEMDLEDELRGCAQYIISSTLINKVCKM